MRIRALCKPLPRAAINYSLVVLAKGRLLCTFWAREIRVRLPRNENSMCITVEASPRVVLLTEHVNPLSPL